MIKEPLKNPGEVRQQQLIKRILSTVSERVAAAINTAATRPGAFMRFLGFVLFACCGLLPAGASLADSSPRLISAGASLTAVLQQLNLADYLVGVDTTSEALFVSKAPAIIGYPRQLGSEGVLSLRPQVLIGTEDMGPPAVLTQLRQAGVEVMLLSAEPSMEALYGNIKRLAERFDRVAEGNQLRAELQAQLAALPPQPETPPQALFLLSHSAGSLLVAGSHTAGGSLLELGGMHNPMAARFSQYRALSAEAFIGLAPLWLITTTQSLEAAGGAERLLALHPALAATPAGRQQNIVGVDGAQMVGGFSPAIPDTLGQLRQAALGDSPAAMAHAE